jgi:hypothetical protein
LLQCAQSIAKGSWNEQTLSASRDEKRERTTDVRLPAQAPGGKRNASFISGADLEEHLEMPTTKKTARKKTAKRSTKKTGRKTARRSTKKR